MSDPRKVPSPEEMLVSVFAAHLLVQEAGLGGNPGDEDSCRLITLSPGTPPTANAAGSDCRRSGNVMLRSSGTWPNIASSGRSGRLIRRPALLGCGSAGLSRRAVLPCEANIACDLPVLSHSPACSTSASAWSTLSRTCAGSGSTARLSTTAAGSGGPGLTGAAAAAAQELEAAATWGSSCSCPASRSCIAVGGTEGSEDGKLAREAFSKRNSDCSARKFKPEDAVLPKMRGAALRQKSPLLRMVSTDDILLALRVRSARVGDEGLGEGSGDRFNSPNGDLRAADTETL